MSELGDARLGRSKLDAAVQQLKAGAADASHATGKIVETLAGYQSQLSVHDNAIASLQSDDAAVEPKEACAPKPAAADIENRQPLRDLR